MTSAGPVPRASVLIAGDGPTTGGFATAVATTATGLEDAPFADGDGPAVGFAAATGAAVGEGTLVGFGVAVGAVGLDTAPAPPAFSAEAARTGMVAVAAGATAADG